MHTRFVNGLTIRPLTNGDTETVAALFERLGDRSREKRFCGAKPRLSDPELSALSRVDGSHHVLVGYLDGESVPAGIARLHRFGGVAEIAFAVADAHQGRGVGSILAMPAALSRLKGGGTSPQLGFYVSLVLGGLGFIVNVFRTFKRPRPPQGPTPGGPGTGEW